MIRRSPAPALALLAALILAGAAGCTTTPEGGENGDGPDAAPTYPAFRIAFLPGVAASDEPPDGDAPDAMNLLADALTRLSTEVSVDAAILAGDLVAADGGSRETLEAVLDTASGLPCTIHTVAGPADLTAIARGEGDDPADPDARRAALATFRRLVDARRPPPPVTPDDGGGAGGAASLPGLDAEGDRPSDESAWLGLVSPGLYLLIVETGLDPAAEAGSVGQAVAPWAKGWVGKIEAAGSEVLVASAHPLEGAAGADELLAVLAGSSACRAVVSGGDAARIDAGGGLLHLISPPLARWPLGFRVIEITPGGAGKIEWIEIGLPEERAAAEKAPGAAAAAGQPADRAGELPPR